MRFKKVSQLFSIIETSSIQEVSTSLNTKHGVSLYIKRDDLLHNIISGNKWRKLKYLLLSIEQEGFSKVATMGGSHSNFAHALSYVCYLLGWRCDLYIRGFAEQPITATLHDCAQWNANIHFVDRKKFREIRNNSPELAEDIYWIPEGGLSKYSILGLQEVMMELNQKYDYIVISTATGTSVAGLTQGANKYQPDTKIIGISVLNNALQQREDVTRLIDSDSHSWSIIEGYEFGGFAKSNLQLKQFSDDFYLQHKILLENVYSGKSFYAVNDLIERGFFNRNSKILLIHCGGLQGRR